MRPKSGAAPHIEEGVQAAPHTEEGVQTYRGGCASGTTYRGGRAIAHPEVLKTKRKKKLYKYCIDVEHP